MRRWTSVSQTSPPGATRRTKALARSPLPLATSSKRSPGRGRASSMANDFHTRCRPSDQVVHQVIALGNAVEYFTHPCRLFRLGYILIPKVDTFRQSKSLLLVAAGARGLQLGKVL